MTVRIFHTEGPSIDRSAFSRASGLILPLNEMADYASAVRLKT